MTRQERIWWELKSSDEPLGTLDLEARLSLPQESIRKAIYDMRKFCTISTVGGGSARRYAIPPGETYRCPGKGNAEGSRRNLRPWNWEKGLKIMQSMRVKGVRTPPKPRPGIALEACWPSMKTCR